MQKICMHLSVLPFRLNVIKLKRESLEQFGFILTKCILFPNESSHKARFFSVTENADEISIVIESEYVSLFQKVGQVEISDISWRAVEVAEGTCGCTTSVVHLLTGPLARAGISVFYISTNKTDFTLVPETKLVAAIECLKENFTVMAEGIDLPATSTSPVTGKAENFSPKKHPLAIPSRKVYMLSINQEILLSLGGPLLKSLFFVENCPEGFFSFTEIDDELSVIVTEVSKDLFPHELTCHEPWKMIKVADGPLGFTEFGIVYSIADPLCSAKIGVFYISSFSTDYTLVAEHSFQQSVECLRKHFVIKDHI